MFGHWKPGALLLAALLALAPAAARADGPKVVLELFTSQGCSSCPSADAYLGELAQTRGDVVALSFHVDYWNYLGWEDRFATAEMTARQRAYAKELGIAYVYTPQLVIDGVRHVTGSDREAVTAGIGKAKAREARRVSVDLEAHAPGRLSVEIGADDGYWGAATVFLASVDRRHTTPVHAGENHGRTLVNHNVVRDFRPIGTWSGEAMMLELDPPTSGGRGEGCAVLVQEKGGKGRILGADIVWLEAAAGQADF